MTFLHRLIVGLIGYFCIALIYLYVGEMAALAAIGSLIFINNCKD